MALSRIPLCLHSCDLSTDSGDAVGDLCHLLLRIHLAAFQQLQFLPGLGELIVKQANLGTDAGLLLFVQLTAACQSFHFLQGSIVGFRNGLQPNFVLLDLTFYGQCLLFLLGKLFPGSSELEFHLICRTARLGVFLLQLCELFGQFLFLLGQLGKLIGTAENTCLPADRAAGHRTACVQNLTVQGYDLKPVAVFFRHRNGLIDGFRNHDAAQQVLHHIGINFIKGHQLGGNAHKAGAVVQSLFLQGSATDGGKGEEGGASAAGAL